VTRLGTLRQLDLDHLDLGLAGIDDELFFRELAVRGAATKIPRADFPDQIATHFTVVDADAAFAGIVRSTKAHESRWPKVPRSSLPRY
jgi:hypothetical protein